MPRNARTESARRVFLVKVDYREPTYRQDGHVYGFTFRCQASSFADATQQALRRFEEMATLSSVGWVREVIAVHVEALACSPIEIQLSE